jgi:hypothetical protein
MTTRRKSRLSLDLETIKALDAVHGGTRRPKQPPVPGRHTPPLHYQSEGCTPPTPPVRWSYYKRCLGH